MRERQEIDLNFRPGSYWKSDSPLLNVKGEFRRREIQQAVENDSLDEIPSSVRADTLSAAAREVAGRIHPVFMGGEYLPDYAETEVEIARVALDSTTHDVISVRASKVGDRIRYQIRDEYETEFVLDPDTFDQPLTLGELVELIDTAEYSGEGRGIVKSWWPYQECEAEEAVAFTTVSSVFYPQLSDWYDQEAEKWVLEHSGGDED